MNVSYFLNLTEADALYHPELWSNFLDEGSEFYHDYGHILAHGGFLDILYIGVKAGIYPSLIFMGVGAMTDFGPLIARPSSLILGADPQHHPGRSIRHVPCRAAHQGPRCLGQ